MDLTSKLLNELNDSFKEGIVCGTRVVSKNIFDTIEKLEKENYSSDFILKIVKEFCKENYKRNLMNEI